MKKIFLPYLLFCLTFVSFSQNSNLKSIVVEEGTSIPVINAIVAINSTTLTGSTNESGSFVIKNIPVGEQIVTVTKKGFETKVFMLDVKEGVRFNIKKIEINLTKKEKKERKKIAKLVEKERKEKLAKAKKEVEKAEKEKEKLKKILEKERKEKLTEAKKEAEKQAKEKEKLEKLKKLLEEERKEKLAKAKKEAEKEAKKRKKEIASLRKSNNANVKVDYSQVPTPTPAPISQPVEHKPSNTNIAEPIGELQLKYAKILNVETSDITNTELYTFIDEWVATPYLLGGATKDGIDCSSFTQLLYMKILKKYIERTAEKQFNSKFNDEFKDKTFLAEGDLVFFKTFNDPNSIGHVGVYLQNNKFVHATSSKDANGQGGVQISNLTDQNWSSRFVAGGKRISEDDN